MSNTAEWFEGERVGFDRSNQLCPYMPFSLKAKEWAAGKAAGKKKRAQETVEKCFAIAKRIQEPSHGD